MATAIAPAAAVLNSLTCEKCNGAMVRAKVARLGVLVQVMGVLLIVPALIGIGLGVVMAIGAIGGAAASGSSEAATAGALGAIAGIGMTLLAFGLSLPILIVGAILVLRRKVWRCLSCGYLFERD